MEFIFNVHNGEETKQISQSEREEFASFYGLDHFIKGRYSALFVINLMVMQYASGLDPYHVIDEIKALEGVIPSRQTKPPTQFKGKHLKGLWHKHFFPAHPSIFAHNILNEYGKNGLNELITEIFDPKKSAVVTKEMIYELSHRVTTEPIENRAKKEKLTGEWIVYAKENDKNYYLGVWSHNDGDENIANSIKSICFREFEFLQKYFS